MNHATRSLRKTLDAVASNNEATALEVMRAVEQVQDDLLRQRLLKAIHHLNQDAAELRALREEVASPHSRRADPDQARAGTVGRRWTRCA